MKNVEIAVFLSWRMPREGATVEDYEGQRCYHLHGINNWGKTNDHFYDQKTGLLVGYEFDSEWRGGPGLTHEIFSEYQKIDGVLVPMKQVVKIKSKSGGDWTVLQVTTYNSVTFNDVDRTVFTPPVSVRDLVSKGKHTRPLSGALAHIQFHIALRERTAGKLNQRSTARAVPPGWRRSLCGASLVGSVCFCLLAAAPRRGLSLSR